MPATAIAGSAPAFVMKTMSYTGDTSAMKVSYAEAPLRADELRFILIAVAVAAVPLLLVSFAALAVGLLFGAVLAAALAAWARRLIGGYTGDVLGATEQMFEVGFLLGVAAVLGS